MSTIRRSLYACALAVLGLTTACSDSVTGPSAKKRSGYITASSAVTVAPTTTTAATGTTSTPVKPKGVETQSSGYNVTAF